MSKKFLLRFRFLDHLPELILLTASALQLLIFFTVATDNNGDPNDYLEIAKRLFSSDAGVNPNRFYGYPLFIRITSLNLANLNLIFLIQSILLLYAVYYFSKSLPIKPFSRGLILLPTLIPAVAYTPKLLFPDSLITSLLLILAALLVNKKIKASLFVIVALIFIKLVFIFLVLLVCTIYAADKYLFFRHRIIFLYLLGMIGLIPAVFIVTPFPLYQTIVQKPGFLNERPIATEAPNSIVISCNNQSSLEIYPLIKNKILEHSSDEALPLGDRISKQFKCTSSEIKAVQRSMVVDFFLQDPSGQIGKLLTRFVRNNFLFFDQHHVGYMLSIKLKLLTEGLYPEIFYEKTQLDAFKNTGYKPLNLPFYELLSLMVWINPIFERLLSQFIIAGLLLTLAFRSRQICKETGAALLLLIISYSWVITIFAFGYDRYLFINYFLWLGIITISLKGFGLQCLNIITKR